jgi:RNA polymerase sigma factor (sigma-70 family)
VARDYRLVNITMPGADDPLATLATSTEPDAARAIRLLREHARALDRLITSYTRSAADREDLHQDVALAVWGAIGHFRGDCSEKTFVLRIATNRAFDFLHRRAKPMADLEEHASTVTATTGSNPALRYERRERENQLMSAVRTLPLTYRQPLTLLLEGLSHREIALAIGTTENNVGVRLNRARAALRVFLGTSAPTDQTAS